MRSPIAILLAGCLAVHLACASPDSSAEPQVGAAPKIADVAKFRLEDYQGKVVLLNFWATWCPPCRAEIPDLVKLQQSFGRDKVAVIGVSVDANGTQEQIRELLGKFVRKYKINYQIVLDSEQRLAQQYGANQFIPTTFLIDQQGKIRQTYNGARPFDVFAQDVDKLLGRS